MKTKIYFFSLLLGTLLINGCKKEGPEGPAGAAGKDGNANVKSSTITFSSWSWDATNLYDYSDFTWGDITSSIANNGGLYIYLSTPGGWVPLPRTIYPNSAYSESQRFVFNTGSFRIIVQDSDLTAPAALGVWTIRAVAVESSGIQQHPGLNWKDYESVKRAFHLKD